MYIHRKCWLIWCDGPVVRDIITGSAIISIPQPDQSAKIVFDVTENPLTFAKISLHYNQFTGISAILNLTSRDFFTPNSRSLVTLNIGENFKVRAEHLQYLGRGRKFALKLSTAV